MTERTKLQLTVGGEMITATLIDSETTDDFVSLLPLTVTVDDLLGREKVARLPREISEKGNHTHTYEVGDIAYWPPGPDMAVYYHHDGQEIPDPGIIVVGKIDSDIEAFEVPDSTEVMIEKRSEI